MNVIICGAGVIGASIAYYLSLRGIGATMVERVDVACAASGKSAGFLALDWCDGTPLESLARVPGIDGAYIATGHDCWGILNAPTSRLAMAELIAEGEPKSVNIAPFDPGRLPRVAEKSISINSARD